MIPEHLTHFSTWFNIAIGAFIAFHMTGPMLLQIGRNWATVEKRRMFWFDLSLVSVLFVVGLADIVLTLLGWS